MKHGRVNMQLDIVNFCNNIEKSDTKSCFYAYSDEGEKDFDISYVGDAVNLVNLFVNIMKGDEEMRDMIEAAVDIVNEDTFDFSQN